MKSNKYSGAYSRRRYSNFSGSDNNPSGAHVISASSANSGMGEVRVTKLSSLSDKITVANLNAALGLGYDIYRVTALPYEGYAFANWTGDVPAGKATENPLQVTLSKDVVLKANFVAAPVNRTLVVRWNGEMGRVTCNSNNFTVGSGTPANGGSITAAAGSTVKLTAEPKDGYRFVRWEGFTVDGSTSKTVELSVADTTVNAVFVSVDSPEEPETPGGGNGSKPVGNDLVGKAMAFVRKWWWALLIAAYFVYKEKGGRK